MGASILVVIGIGIIILFVYLFYVETSYTFSFPDEEIVRLVICIIKSDNIVSTREIRFVDEFIKSEFGLKSFEIFQKSVSSIEEFKCDLEALSIQLSKRLDSSDRNTLFRFLVQVVVADGVNEKEINELKKVSEIFKINRSKIDEYIEFYSVKFTEDFNGFAEQDKLIVNSAYKALGISSKSSLEVLKKAFRSKAKEMHPDKVNHLGEEYIAKAKKDFQRLLSFYEIIKKDRQIK